MSISEMRTLARRVLPGPVFALADGGAGDGSGLARNVELLRAYRLHPRVLTGVSTTDQSVSLFGKRYASPFGISAAGMAGLFWPRADRLLAQAAAAANIPFLLSTCSSDALEDVAPLAGENLWFQLYPAKDPQVTDAMVTRANRAGVGVLVVTVDWPVAPRFETVSVARRNERWRRMVEAIRHPAWTLRYLQAGAPLFGNWRPFAPVGADAAGIAAYAATQWPCPQSWDDIARIRDLWPGKLVLKGISHPDDAYRAQQMGVDGITVSNHGGKAHSRFPATTEMLQLVRAAVGDRIVVMADGGIEHGADAAVLKCLGADFSFFGRATLYGAAAGGMTGIERVIALLREDVTHLLMQLGCATFEALDSTFLMEIDQGPFVANGR
jgi:(S)-mandelate dehydrogenase